MCFLCDLVESGLRVGTHKPGIPRDVLHSYAGGLEAALTRTTGALKKVRSFESVFTDPTFNETTDTYRLILTSILRATKEGMDPASDTFLQFKDSAREAQVALLRHLLTECRLRYLAEDADPASGGLMAEIPPLEFFQEVDEALLDPSGVNAMTGLIEARRRGDRMTLLVRALEVEREDLRGVLKTQGKGAEGRVEVERLKLSLRDHHSFLREVWSLLVAHHKIQSSCATCESEPHRMTMMKLASFIDTKRVPS